MNEEGQPPENSAERDRAAFVDQLWLATPRLWAIHAVVAANILVFFLMVAADRKNILSPQTSELLKWGGNLGYLTASGEWWRLFTSFFVHAGIIHCALNMAALIAIGGLAERLFGNWFFLAIYLACGFAASLCTALFSPDSSSVGASGAVFGIFGAVGSYLLRERATIPRGIFKHIGKGTASFVGVNLCIGFAVGLIGGVGGIHIDQAAHVGGLLAGVLYGFLAARPLEISQRRRITRLTAATFGFAAAGVIFLLFFNVQKTFKLNTQNFIAVAALYGSGQGVPKDLNRSIYWLRKAAEQGNVRAEGDLGRMYFYGNEVARNPTEAFKWLQKAAIKGDADAQKTIAWMHARGDGTPQDGESAIKWFLKSADKGDAGAEVAIAEIFLSGLGAPKDAARAFPWLLKAADKGSPESFALLSALYANGEFVGEDLVEAYKWLALAQMRQPTTEGQLALAAMGHELLPSEIADANTRIQKFLQQIRDKINTPRRH